MINLSSILLKVVNIFHNNVIRFTYNHEKKLLNGLIRDPTFLGRFWEKVYWIFKYSVFFHQRWHQRQSNFINFVALDFCPPFPNSVKPQLILIKSKFFFLENQKFMLFMYKLMASWLVYHESHVTFWLFGFCLLFEIFLSSCQIIRLVTNLIVLCVTFEVQLNLSKVISK